MAEANAPAASNAAAVDTNVPVTSNAEAARQNADAAAARKAFDAEKVKLAESHSAEIAKREEKISELRAQHKAEREWRMGVLDTRAKTAGMTPGISELARNAGPEAYEKAIAEFEGFKGTSSPAKPTGTLPGGSIGGTDAPTETLDGYRAEQIDPLKNGYSKTLYETLSNKMGRKTVDAFLAKADQRQKK